jgi:transposase InsO family protein
MLERRSRRLRALCRLLGYSRQAYYQYGKAESKRVLQEDLLMGQVLLRRQVQPRLGTRKLHELLQPFMHGHGFYLGRDELFALLRSNNLLIRTRRTKPKTTFSNHMLKRYADLAKGLVVNRPNALWVSDITYIRLFNNQFAYLSLITDAYSRKIVGFHLSANLSADSALEALRMALRDNAIAKGSLIHHSDRGTQYCSYAYTGLLAGRHIGISMTQGGDPRDNAIAERVNGILKQELLEEAYPNIRSANQAIEKAINIYNDQRLHTSIDMLTPQQAHQRTGQIRRRWKSYHQKNAREPVAD